MNLEAESLGLPRQHDLTGPHNVLGIELNEYAAELARVTVWIGELQWRLDKGYGFKTQPVLEPLNHIECRDALLALPGKASAEPPPQPSNKSLGGPIPRLEAAWPDADVVIGNPPFVGDKKMRGELGADYTESLRACFKDRVPGGADLVCYWFEKARAQIEAGRLQRAGLVSTNSIRGGKNRAVLDRTCETTRIFEAWSDEAWVNNGAAVRVSLVAFGHTNQKVLLEGQGAYLINADLTNAGSSIKSLDLTQALRLSENMATAFIGGMKKGRFDVDGGTARKWLESPNPNGRSNAEVLRPWFNGLDITRRPADAWIIDFGIADAMNAASLYEAPFSHVLSVVKPAREVVNNAREREMWWLHARSAPDLREAAHGLHRVAVTARNGKHRFFAWLPASVVLDGQIVAFTRADDTTVGLLQARLHELWTLRMCSWLGVGNDPRYTPTTCFETFPFPAGLTPVDTAHQRTEALPDGTLIPAGLTEPARSHAVAIAQAAKQLTDRRDRWLNPPEWCQRVPEVVPLGMTTSPYPDRIVALPGFEAELAKRTLTHLYNLRPAWLAEAHASLDRAVAAAYGWHEDPATLEDDELLRRLLALNHARANIT